MLIHGAAGGVGHVALQLARWTGATVFATAGADDLEFVRALGAKSAIDYRNERFEEVATDLDLVFDTQGGDTQKRSLAALKRGGCLVTTLEPDEERAARAGVRISPRWHAQPNAAQLGRIADLLASGDLRIEVARTFPADAVQEAYRFARDGHPRGKVVLTF